MIITKFKKISDIYIFSTVFAENLSVDEIILSQAVLLKIKTSHSSKHSAYTIKKEGIVIQNMGGAMHSSYGLFRTFRNAFSENDSNSI